ncbi:MAG: STAS domain-containing protein [Clostridia bacterium]|nr:STAS domain-containing protein [Clostridia bacterium]
MNIEMIRNGRSAVITVDGRLDTMTSPEFEKYLNENIEGIDELTVDCEKLKYVSSAGLRVLLSAHKRMSAVGGMKLVNVSEIVNEVFEITRFSDILNIE